MQGNDFEKIFRHDETERADDYDSTLGSNISEENPSLEQVIN